MANDDAEVYGWGGRKGLLVPHPRSEIWPPAFGCLVSGIRKYCAGTMFSRVGSSVKMKGFRPGGYYDS